MRSLPFQAITQLVLTFKYCVSHILSAEWANAETKISATDYSIVSELSEFDEELYQALAKKDDNKAKELLIASPIQTDDDFLKFFSKTEQSATLEKKYETGTRTLVFAGPQKQ